MLSGFWGCLQEAYDWLASNSGQEFIELSIIAVLFMLIGVTTFEPIEALFSNVYLYLVKIG